MTKGFIVRLFSVVSGFALAFSPRADAPLKFDEIYSLVRSNLTDVSDAELSKAAALGFIEKLGGKVELSEGASGSGNSPAIARTNIFQNDFAYVRLNRVASGAAQQITDAIKSNKRPLKGIILDLRFAKGDDYPAAVEIVNAFIDGEATVLKWGDQVGKTKAKADAITLPVVVLINRQTFGAAEALAGALWHEKIALLIGNRTAGQATAFEDFPLSNGQHLKIARSKVELGNGKAIGLEGLVPDLVVEADEKNERSWLDDPYRVITRPGMSAGPQPFLTSVTNRVGRRLNGAEVARRHREELNQDEPADAPRSTDSARAGAEERAVQDAALVRALDYLKGIAAMQQRDAAAKSK